MGDDIAQKLTELPKLSRKQLLDLWEELFERATPCGLRREFLIPFLAYRIQEKAYGGLKPSTRAELRRIARDFEQPKAEGKRPPPPRIKLGTKIVRSWRGAMHEVFVTDLGFEYQGTTYGSLSEIARKITGTRWSGPAFFALNKQGSKRGTADGE